MANGFLNAFRLARIGAVLFWRGAADVIPEDLDMPAARMLRRAGLLLRHWRGENGKAVRLSNALASLGPSYIKLGQFLATRRDIIGPELANDLAELQDRLPPFSMDEAKRVIRESLGAEPDALFETLSEPVAAASIAQVHQATIRESDGRVRKVAVKILRPGVDARFRHDLSSFYFAARKIERWHQASRRLRPVAVVDTLAESVRLEMDLRFEAAAISEMTENIKKSGDAGFRVPKVDWQRTSARVLTTEWIDAIPIADLDAINAAGIDREALGNNVIRTFLRHAMRDGFFHADMHQGNLFVEPNGMLVAVDFGIMGRLSAKERHFLAEILYGFIVRDYQRTAQAHIDAGYVPSSHSVEAFAQAVRSIGEPLVDRTAEEIHMAVLLSQLLEITDLFDMQTRPELLLLQKTMVVVEGVARSLDPRLNMWNAAGPVVKEWMAEQIGPRAKFNEALEGLGALAGLLAQAPKLAEQAGRVGEALAKMAESGTLLETSLPAGKNTTEAETRLQSSKQTALWICAVALGAIAIKMWFG
ncbi:MAG: 2-polyprenylphenol 6-hydroxylase [Alphaproteobacteria bacterium]